MAILKIRLSIPEKKVDRLPEIEQRIREACLYHNSETTAIKPIWKPIVSIQKRPSGDEVSYPYLNMLLADLH